MGHVSTNGVTDWGQLEPTSQRSVAEGQNKRQGRRDKRAIWCSAIGGQLTSKPNSTFWFPAVGIRILKHSTEIIEADAWVVGGCR
ncbi:hypothetical protein Pmani_025500 [Petrolisthes manimaculis]|uniref:Uncharacterized protein n=1 Tax=Petrolisthes manimaculis TaxID=1843537 RepID=A0AAE1TXK6_9EUCA|nr:hypothetical protein Pmani_025500 [Petrolisthes manimaculis]